MRVSARGDIGPFRVPRGEETRQAERRFGGVETPQERWSAG